MKLAQRLLPGKHQSIAGYVTKLLILAADFIFAFFSFFLALLITTKFRLVDAQNMVGWAVVLILLLRMAAFRAFRTYLIIIRYIGEKDYKNVFLAITASSVVFAAFLFLIPTLISRQDILPVVIADYAILLVLAIGARMLMRMLMNQKAEQERGSHLNTAIFGAGELGSMLMRVLQYNGSHHYRPVAFFDDNPKVHGKVLNGIPVFNPKLDFEKVVRKYDIRTAIIGINKLPEERRIHFINDCLDHNIKVMKVPPTEDWLSNTLNIGQLKDIRFEDLLNRPPIQLDEEAIRESVNGKVVLVTGCAGSIGSEIVRQLLRYRPGLIVGIDQAETPLAELAMSLHKQVDDGLFLPNIGDVKDYDALYHLFQQYEPEYVFHAAAYKHVPMMERFPAEAIKANVLGTQHVAGLSSRFRVKKFVMISTDKVVNPGNIMGASKRIAELYVQSLNYASGNKTQFITTRFGNVLGSNGSVIPIFKQQIENREPVTVTDPGVTRFFMTIPEACQLVLEAGAMGNGGEIFIFDMGEPVRIVELAKKMIQMAGLKPGKDIEIVYTGLRPGEKLTEELLDEGEDIITTHHPKICKAATRPCNHDEIRRAVETLVAMARSSQDNYSLVRLMKDLVPEFTSQNSEFAGLDGQRGKSISAPGKE